MITKVNLLSEREQMQEDLLCVLDGLDGLNALSPTEITSFKDAACQVIVNGVNRLIEKT